MTLMVTAGCAGLYANTTAGLASDQYRSKSGIGPVCYNPSVIPQALAVHHGRLAEPKYLFTVC